MIGVTTQTSNTSAGDASLVERLRRNEPAAYEELVRHNGGRMLASIRRLLRNEEDAQDALQEAFLSAFKAIGGFSEKAQLSTWLHRIAINAALMKLRSRRRRPEQSIEPLLPTFLADGHQAAPAADWGASVASTLQRNEMAEAVRAAIDELPESYRVVLQLRDIEELDTNETARLLGLEESAAKTRLHRARQALRTILDRRMQGRNP